MRAFDDRMTLEGVSWFGGSANKSNSLTDKLEFVKSILAEENQMLPLNIPLASGWLAVLEVGMLCAPRDRLHCSSVENVLRNTTRLRVRWEGRQSASTLIYKVWSQDACCVFIYNDVIRLDVLVTNSHANAFSTARLRTLKEVHEGGCMLVCRSFSWGAPVAGLARYAHRFYKVSNNLRRIIIAEPNFDKVISAHFRDNDCDVLRLMYNEWRSNFHVVCM